jgi:hypothetical protein
MAEKQTRQRAARDKREGKAPSTQAGEYVREEMHHVREGKHGAASTKQAIAIGLSKARREGVRLPPPGRGTTSSATREKARRDCARGSRAGRKASPRRSRATRGALKRQPRSAALRTALSRQARSAARRRRSRNRS